MITIPEPWANNDTISMAKTGFLSVLCHDDGAMGWSCSILFSDGDVMGAVLDETVCVLPDTILHPMIC